MSSAHTKRLIAIGACTWLAALWFWPGFRVAAPLAAQIVKGAYLLLPPLLAWWVWRGDLTRWNALLSRDRLAELALAVALYTGARFASAGVSGHALSAAPALPAGLSFGWSTVLGLASPTFARRAAAFWASFGWVWPGALAVLWAQGNPTVLRRALAGVSLVVLAAAAASPFLSAGAPFVSQPLFGAALRAAGISLANVYDLYSTRPALVTYPWLASPSIPLGAAYVLAWAAGGEFRWLGYAGAVYATLLALAALLLGFVTPLECGVALATALASAAVARRLADTREAV